MASHKNLPLTILALLLVGSFGGIQAADRFWVAAGPGAWETAANWSATSGGAGGATVPGPSDRARFNSLRLGNCTLSTPISVGGILIEAGFTGTITQGAGQTLTVGSQAFSQAAGTWLGNNVTFTVNGAFALSGGSFTSTSGVLAITGNFTHTLGGTFAPNGGTVTLSGAAATIDVATSETFFNLTLAKTNAVTLTVAASDTLIVQNQLTLTDGLVSQTTVPASGTIQANGNILQEVGFDGGTATLAITGSVPQTFTGNATQTAGQLPNVVLRSTSTLALQGTLRTAKNWTYTSGMLQPGTSTVVFAGTLSITGSHALSNVVFNTNSSAAATITLGATTSLSVAESLLFANSSATKGALTLNTGTISAQGPITVADNANYSGSATLLINGTADQAFSCNATRTVGGLPKITINKPSGTLSLSGLFRVVQSWTWTAGVVAPGTSTVVFAAAVTITGSHTLSNVTFDSNSTAAVAVTIASGTTLSVSGALLIDNSSTGTLALNTGTVAAQGSITFPDAISYSGSATLLINGIADQAFSCAATRTAGGLPKVTINKPSGTLSLSGTFRVVQNWTWTAGAVAPGTSTVVIAAGVTITGSHTLANVTFDTNSSGATTVTLATGTTLSVSSTLLFDNTSTGTIALNTGTVAAQGPITIADAINYTGTGTLLINGTSDQLLTSAATALSGGLPAITVNKPSGTLTLAGTLRLVKSWNRVAGTLSAGFGPVVIADTLTVTGTQSWGDLSVNANSATAKTLTLATGTTLTVGGTLSLDNTLAGAFTLNGGTIAAQGASVVVDDRAYAGTTLLLVNGTGNQTLTGGATLLAGTLPPLTINKPSGTLSLTGTLRTGKNWTYTAGALDAGTSTLILIDTLTVTGSHALNNLILNSNSTAAKTITVATGTTLTVNGALTFDNTLAGAITPNGGTIWAKGNLVADNQNFTGTTSLVLNGAGPQTFTGSATLTSGGLPPVTISKPAGTVLTLTGTLRTGKNWTYTSGNLDAGSSTLVLADALTVSGTQTLGAITFNTNSTTSKTIAIAGGSVLTASGPLVLDNSSTGAMLLTGSLAAQGNITSDATVAGTATLALTGGNDQALNCAKLPTGAVTVNKTAGTASLAAALLANAAGQTLTVTAGTLDLAGFNLTVGGALTVGPAGAIRLQGGETVARGSLALQAGSTVTYYGAGAYTGLALGSSYAHLNFAGSGSWAQTAAVTVAGDVKILQGTLNSAGYDISLAGSWMNAAGYSSGANTVTLNGGNQSIQGQTSFNNLTKTVAAPATLTFEHGVTQTVLGGLTLKGVAGGLLSLRSDLATDQWKISAQGSRLVEYVDVKDTYNLTLPFILPANSVDSGNTVRWFPQVLIANPDSHLVAKGASLAVPQPGVMGNDSGQGPLDALLATSTNFGTLTLNSDGSFLYVPVPSFAGNDAFSYKITDGNSESAVVTVSIRVNAPPVAVADQYATAKATPLVIQGSGVLSNDTDENGDLLTAILDLPSANGTLDLDPSGSFTYTPSAGFTGLDSFSYRASDGYNQSAPVAVLIQVNSALVAENQTITTAEDTAVPITLTATEANGNTLRFSILTQPDHGSLSGTLPNLTYLPGYDFAGQDSFTFQAHDGSAASNSATITLTVQPVNDTPIASDAAVVTDEDTPVSITLAASDADLDPLTYRIANPPAHGSLTGTPPNLLYTPNPDYSGTDSFTFEAFDGTIGTGTISITVVPVNDPPFAPPQSISLLANTSVRITLTAIDPDSPQLTYRLLWDPQYGVLTGTPPNLIYTPYNASYNPFNSYQDSFGFVANDGIEDSPYASVFLNVNPINQTNGWGQWPLDDGYGDLALNLDGDGWGPGILHGDPLWSYDFRGRVLSFDGMYSWGEWPEMTLSYAQDLTSCLWFKSQSLYSMDGVQSLLGTDTNDEFAVQIENNGYAISFSNGPSNKVTWDGPNGAGLGLRQDQWYHLAVVRNQALGEVELFLNGVSHGIKHLPLNTLASQILLVGAGGFDGGYTISRRFNGSMSDLRVFWRVLTPEEIRSAMGYNDREPLAFEDTFDMSEVAPPFAPGQSLLLNDWDLDFDPLTVLTEPQFIQGPYHGTLQLEPNGYFTYIPDASFTGFDYFYYRASDGYLTSAPTKVTILSVPRDPPAAPAGLIALSNPLTPMIELHWEDRSDNESTFEVERRIPGGSFATLATLQANRTTYLDASLLPLTEYAYRVRAVNQRGPSAYSREVSVRSGEVNDPPFVAESPTAQPNPVRTTSTFLTVVGEDDGGESNLSYTWSVVGTPPGAVTLGAPGLNGTHAASRLQATFTAPGTYNLAVAVQDSLGLSVSAPLAVEVILAPAEVVVSPNPGSVSLDATLQFSAAIKDQFQNPMPNSTTPVYWNVSGGGWIDNQGIFSATGYRALPGVFTVTATCGSAKGTAELTVVNSAAVRIWSGLGLDDLWTNTDNWVGNELPGPGDNVLFDGGANQNHCEVNIPSTIRSLTIRNGTKPADIVVSSNLLVSTTTLMEAGALWMSYGQHQFSGPVTVQGGIVRAQYATLQFDAGFELSGGTFEGNDATLTFKRTLTVSGGLFGAHGANMLVEGQLAITNGVFSAPFSYSLRLGSGLSVTVPGIFQPHQDLPIELTGSYMGVISGVPSLPRLWLRKTGLNGYVRLQGPLVIQHELDLGGGSLSITGGPLDLKGDLLLSGPSTIGGMEQPLRISGTTDQTLDLPETLEPLGTIEIANSSGIVHLNSGFTASQLNILSGATVRFGAGRSFTLVQAPVWQGQLGTPITLRSSVPGQRWWLKAPPCTAYFVDVQDSDATLGGAVTPTECVDSGNNLNWLFTTPDYFNPQITNLLPANGALLTTRRPVFSADYSDQGSGIDVARVQLELDGQIVTTQAGVTATRCSFLPGFDLSEQALHTFKLTVFDNAGNKASAITAITIDATPPGLPLLEQVIPGPDRLIFYGQPDSDAVEIVATAGAFEVESEIRPSWSATVHRGNSTSPSATIAVRLRDKAGNEGPEASFTESFSNIPTPLPLSISGYAAINPKLVKVTTYYFKTNSVTLKARITGGRAPIRAEINGIPASCKAGSMYQALKLAEGEHALQLLVTDATGQTATQTIRVAIENTPPLIQILYPDPIVTKPLKFLYLNGRTEEECQQIRTEIMLPRNVYPKATFHIDGLLTDVNTGLAPQQITLEVREANDGYQNLPQGDPLVLSLLQEAPLKSSLATLIPVADERCEFNFTGPAGSLSDSDRNYSAMQRTYADRKVYLFTLRATDQLEREALTHFWVKVDTTPARDVAAVDHHGVIDGDNPPVSGVAVLDGDVVRVFEKDIPLPRLGVANDSAGKCWLFPEPHMVSPPGPHDVSPIFTDSVRTEDWAGNFTIASYIYNIPAIPRGSGGYTEFAEYAFGSYIAGQYVPGAYLSMGGEFGLSIQGDQIYNWEPGTLAPEKAKVGGIFE